MPAKPAPAASPAAPVLLWPRGAPGALGDSPEDRPNLVPFLLPPDPSGRPRACVIVCPGGGYVRRAPHEADPVALMLNAAGISALVLHYRVAPYRHPQPLYDAQRAIRIARSSAGSWNIDPARIAVLGFSAGGHLAASSAVLWDRGDPAASDPISRQSCRPDALVACYPVITFGPERHQGTMASLIGENPDEELRKSLCLETRVTPQTPPSFLWHTADDAGVPVANSLLFSSALARNNVPFELHVYPHGRHGLGLAAEDPVIGTWPGLCTAWLLRTL